MWKQKIIKLGHTTLLNVPVAIARLWAASGITHVYVAWDGESLTYLPIHPGTEACKPTTLTIRRIRQRWPSLHQ